MAANTLDPRIFFVKSCPPTFDIDTDKDDWRGWKLEWTHYLIFSGLTKLNTEPTPANPADGAADNVQRGILEKAKRSTTLAALMPAMARPTLRVLQNLDMTANEHQDPDTVLAKLEAHIEGDTNYRVHRQQFYNRLRHTGEPFDDYIVALRDISQKCNFVAPAINTIAEDRILQLVIMGINDQDVTEKLLQLNNTTTYAQATAQARSIIAAKRDAAKGTSSGAATSRVHTTARPPQTPAWIAPTTDRTGPCPQCGYNKHRGTS
jgi:hypothetical protein